MYQGKQKPKVNENESVWQKSSP